MANHNAALRRTPHHPDLQAFLDYAGSATPTAFNGLGSGARS